MKTPLALMIASALALTACQKPAETAEAPPSAESPAATNPFFAASKLQDQTPDFSAIKDSDFAPAAPRPNAHWMGA